MSPALSLDGDSLTVYSHRDGGGLKLSWSSLNTNWTTCRIGSSSSNYTTLTRTTDFTVTGGIHHTGASQGAIVGSPIYIPNSNGASLYFALLG